MIATAVLIMLAGRLTHLAELNISHVPCVQGDFRVVYSDFCKILSILPFSKPCVYTWGIDVEMVGIDDRRIATGVLYEHMKHRAGLSFGNMWTLIEGLRYTI